MLGIEVFCMSPVSGFMLFVLFNTGSVRMSGIFPSIRPTSSPAQPPTPTLNNPKQDAFEIAQHYHAIYDTPAIQADAAAWQAALQACVIFLIISPHRLGHGLVGLGWGVCISTARLVRAVWTDA